ncbi:MAG: alpha/beta hydrolase [Syntrophomonadaceae bacterium]|nr:alpha/beta hydrolase [Syntrophomonadaceae bacterium]
MKMTPIGNKKYSRIDVKEKIMLGGVEQWIALRSSSTHNPILLFLHGGPGTAQISFSRKSQSQLEKDFLVVNWDQRGAGRSYKSTLKKDEMRIEHFVKDGEELAEALLQRFNHKKLFLIGHSWGSIIGAHLSAKRPDLFWAYIGIGQVVNMDRGEKLSYKFTLDEAHRENNPKAIRELEKIGEPPYKDLSAAGVQRKWLARFNGETYKGTSLGTILKNVSIRDLGPLDLFKFIKGAMFSLKSLEEEQNKVNLFIDVPEINVPVFFCSGRRDYNVPFELVVEYMAKLRAPHKEMIWFEKSAHLPNFEEPDVFHDFCLSKLKNLANADY